MMKSLIDAQSRDAFTRRAAAANQKAEPLSRDADERAARAEKIQKDNPNSFKKWNAVKRPPRSKRSFLLSLTAPLFAESRCHNRRDL
jgi:hypothetical protein